MQTARERNTNKAFIVAIILIIILITPLALFYRYQYIYYLRVPILGIFFLVLLPLISNNPLLRNLFIFRHKWQLALVIPAVLIACLAVANVFETILVNAPTRFDFVPPPEWQLVRDIILTENKSFSLSKLTIQILAGKDLLAFLLGSSICITAINRSRKDSRLSRDPNNHNSGGWILPGVLLGLFLALVFIFLVNSSTSLLTNYVNNDDTFLERYIINLIQLLPQEGETGYLTPKGGLAGSHLSNLAFLLVVLFFYIVSGICGCYLLRPHRSKNEHKTEEEAFNVPALFYLMLITIGITLFFGAATFLLDYYLIPLLLVFLVLSALIYRVFNVDHYYQLNEISQRKNPIVIDEINALKDFKDALQNRLELQKENYRDTLVVVCASGGGIQAAGWTVKVLTGLQETLRTEFTKAIGFISSVSGGSVGTMYYLDRFNQEHGYPLEEEFENIFNSATANSLDATGWGLAYLDLWRFIGFPWILRIFQLGQKDRGTAIEKDWKGNLKQNPEETSLDTWRNQALAGQIPIPVFNATLVDNGYRFLLSPMTFIKQSNEGKKYQDFNNLYGQYNYDIDVTTAARLSATFPYVTPICRNRYPNNQQKQENNYHVADGGYFDNFGVFTAVEWLDKVVLEALNEELQLKKIIILQINAFHSSAPENNNSSTKKGWLMSLAGPLLAVFKVRSSTQTDRNDLEIKILKEKWEKQQKDLKIEHVKVEFPEIKEQNLNEIEKEYGSNDDDGQKWDLFLNGEGKYEPPLSWKLSEFEKAMIQYAWDKVKEEVSQKIKDIWEKCDKQTTK